MCTQKTSILVIDGDADAQLVFSSMLQSDVYNVTIVATGEAAIELLGQPLQFDLILLNSSLPDISGVEVLARVRAKHSLTEVPVIVFAEEASNEVLEQSQELGASDLLLKPFKFSLALKRIEDQLKLKRAIVNLQIREVKTRNILDAIPDLIFRYSSDGVILDLSPPLEAEHFILGNVRLGGIIKDTFPAWFVNNVGKFRDSHPLTGSLDLKRHSVELKGKQHVFESRIIACQNSEFVCIIRDVSAQAKIENELRDLASTDALTRLANRRQFDETLATEWRRATRRRTPVSLALIDVDFFKLYNDSLGHLAGDQCLRKVAASVRSSLKRPGDFAARFGGEEFAIVIPETDFSGAKQVAERVRETVFALAEPHPQSDLRVVTVSIGVATVVPDKDMVVSVLIRRADEALYEAKRSGRNRVSPQEN